MFTAPPVIIPEHQFCDGDGNPYAGGTLATFVPGTSTPKTCWIDPDKTALASNPVILDAAGRCLLYGDGEYRLILRDAAGNEVWDIEATTLVSSAMAPVILAPTIADAQELLGINDLIDAEALARSNADSAEQNARIAADNVERNARETGDTDLYNGIVAEQNRALAAEAHLQTEIDALSGGGGPTPSFQSGTATITGGTVLPGGAYHLTFPTPFATACTAIVCMCSDAWWTPVSTTLWGPTFIATSVTTTGCTIYAKPWDGTTGYLADVPFYWIATGH
jgi:hypothetical protein